MATANTGLAKLAVQWLNRAHLGSARCALSESSGAERHKSFLLVSSLVLPGCKS